MIEFIIKKLMAYCQKRGRVFNITGSAGPEDVYLIRYYVMQNRYFNIFIHQFLRSDRDDLHDHPWDFCTYLVKGAYTENRFNPKTKQIEPTRRMNATYDDYMRKTKLKQNTLVFRRATDQHQVVVDRDLKYSEKDQAALTLFVSGPTRREWGFIKEELQTILCPDGLSGCAVNHREKVRNWVPWRKYLGLPADAPGRG